jgi:very-short-patch-repair endonuclease
VSEHPDARISALARRQLGIVHIDQLRRLGLTRDQIRGRVARGSLHPLHRGVYAVGHGAVSQEARWLAAVLAFGPGAVLSHTSAGARLEIGSFSADGRIHVSGNLDRKNRAGIVLHNVRLAPAERGRSGPIPITSPARTLLDMAGMLPPHRVQRAVHEAEVRRLCSPPELREILALHPGARGARRLRAVVEMGGGNDRPTRSELEDRFLRLLRRHEVRLPQTNQRIDTGAVAFEVDCLWMPEGLVVELDGALFHGTAIAKERDANKDRALTAVGLAVIHVTWNAVVRDGAAVARDVARALKLRRDGR